MNTVQADQGRSERVQSSGRPRLNLSQLLLAQSRSVAGLVVAVAIVWVVFWAVTDGIFLSDRNLINLMRQTAITAMVSLGMLVVIAQGEIDLSVGSFMSLCVTVIAMLEASGSFNPAVTILAALALGALVGIWNGLWVAKLGVPAFVVTLGGLMAFRGLALALSGGRTISGISDPILFLGEEFVTGPVLWLFLAVAGLLALAPLRKLRSDDGGKRTVVLVLSGLAAVALLAWATLSYRGLPMPVAMTLVAAAALSWVLRNTVWGRHVYAVGGNRAAARSAGIHVGRHVIVGFILISMLASTASLMFVGRLGSAPPEAGLFLELNAIAAVVIGGASLYGGTGTVTGVLLGALLMQSLSNGLSLLNVPTAYQNMTSGLVLVLAVYLDVVSKRGGRLFLRQS